MGWSRYTTWASRHRRWLRPLGKVTNGDLFALWSQHDTWEREDAKTLSDDLLKRTDKVEDQVRELGKEMGELKGQVGILVWLMGGTLLVLVASFVKSLL